MSREKANGNTPEFDYEDVSEEIESMDDGTDVAGEVSKALDAKAVKYEAQRIARNEAKASLRQAMKAAVDGIVSCSLKDLLLTVGAGQASGIPRVKGMGRKSMNEQILDMFRGPDGQIEAGTKVSGMDIFNAFDIGYPRMKWLIAASIKDVKKKTDRIWMDFDRAEGIGGTYTVWGIGEAVPENWGGYLPSDESLL